MKRYVCKTQIAVLLLLAVMTACSDETDSSENDVSTQASDTTVLETTAETVSDLCIDSLTPEDFGGAEFRVQTNNILAGYTLPTTINYASEETGEMVNDTLFRRDRWIEETYNVTMTYQYEDNAASQANQIIKAIQAGDDAYDLFIRDIASFTTVLAASNCIYPLNYIDTIHLDREYWMPDLTRDFSVAGSVYFPASAISPRYYGSAYVIMFNRELAESLDMGDLYDVVADGKWTLDKLYTLSREGYSDLNGDGKIKKNDDRFGFIYEILTPEAMILGAGLHYVQNENGRLVSNLEDPVLVDTMQKMAAFLQEDCVIYDDGAFDEVIRSGRYLFSNPCTFNLASYRDLEYDYGILPMPKLNEEQDRYYAYSQPWATAVPSIPITLTGDALSRVGTITDAMAAYGYDYIRPAVFDNVIQLKGTQDERSGSIIDMMFDNVTFEPSVFLNCGPVYNTTIDYFVRKLGKQDIVSSYAAVKSKTEAAMQTLTETFESYQRDLTGE